MSVMKKQLMKVRQIADQTIFRSDKTEVLNKELEQTEKRLDGLKQPCQVLYKKMRSCHQGFQEPMDKRRKHMPEMQLSNSMTEFLETHLEGNTLLWQVLKCCSVLQESLGDTLLEAQLQAEKDVILTLQDFSEKEIHNVGKLRKQLFKLSQDMDSARFRYESSVKNMQPVTLKTESFKEEVEELSMKVEQARDTYAAEVYALISRESSICQSFVQWYEMQTAYHEKCLQILNSSTPAVQEIIDKSYHHPLYGYSLEDHLQRTGREIALVLEACVSCLVETAINEEGLFRIAGSASKVKKLKNALDSGLSNMYEYVTDPHAVAGALKSYLRALPEPLMTYSAYDKWIQADRISDSDTRLQTLWQVLNEIPKANYNNLRYLIKFLHCLCKNSDYNKMSSQNLSIVISPNLLWSPASQQSNHIGLNMSAANAHSSIVETLISYCDWFFPEEVVFRQTLGPMPSPKVLLTPPIADDVSTSSKGIINTAFEGANGESEDSVSGNGQSPRVIHRPGKKPAPPVPQVLGNQSSDTPVDSCPNLRESPPIQHTERSISRSATLDRPGKPKRAPTRKSHDNLASLLPFEDSLQIKQQPEIRLDADAALTLGKKEPTSQCAGKMDSSSQSGAGATNHFSSAKERSIERANWFMGDSQIVGATEPSSQPPGTVFLRSQSVPRKEESTPQVAPKSENFVNVQEVAEQLLVSGSETSDNQSQETSVEKPVVENTSKIVGGVTNQSGVSSMLAHQDASAGQSDVPSAPPTKRKDVVRRPSQESLSQLYASENPLSVPVYENISNQLNKNVDSVRQQQPVDRGTTVAVPQVNLKQNEQKVVYNRGISITRVEGDGAVVPHCRSQEGPDREKKPQVPSKPAIISAESRSAQESSYVVCSGDNNPLADDQGSSKTRVGDKWQFLTSGQRADRMPDRPPKVGPPEGVEGAESQQKPPPSPSSKIKPPRPQPPAPPVKSKPSSEAEDTRL